MLNNIQTALLEGHSGRETFLPYAKDYVTIVQQRLENNPDYVKKELDRETIEGTGKLVKKVYKGNTVTATFTKVGKGTYYVGLHAYNRTSEDGKKVFGPWSNAKKVVVK